MRPAADESPARAAFVCPLHTAWRGKEGDMPAPLKLAHDLIMRAREDYVAQKNTGQIMAECRLSVGTFYKLLAGKGPAAGLPAIVLRRDLGGERAKRPDRIRASLVDRLWRTADKQVREIEKRLRLDQKPDARERDARMLATMVRTLRELRALDAARGEQEPAPEHEHGPDNLDDFRRDLARKIDAIIARRGASPARDAGP
jgi:hypothetical protein